VLISAPTTEHSEIWVGLFMTSSKKIAQNTQETFDWASSAMKTYLGYLCFVFYSKLTKTLNGRNVSSSNTIRSLATIRIFLDFEVRVASRARFTASHDRKFAGPFG